VDKLLEKLLGWSEVWALLIPLTIFFLRRKHISNLLKPVVIYLWIALALNSIADFSWQFQRTLNLPQWARNNLPVYVVHSIARLLLFSWFFNRLKQPFLVNIKKLVPVLFLIFVVIYFSFIKSFKSLYGEFNSPLHATEAALLLFYCLQYYWFLLKQEETHFSRTRSVGWIVAGLTIYVAVNFFIFLFYDALMKTSERSWNFAYHIWDVHNISYIVLCCFIAKAFYDSDTS